MPPKPYFILLQCFLFNIGYPRKIFHIDMRQFLLTPSITKVKLLFEKKEKDLGVAECSLGSPEWLIYKYLESQVNVDGTATIAGFIVEQ